MIEKTDAIVLRIRPFSQTSHIVSWLSPKFGRFDTVVKGACRRKSDFLGQYDLFYTCELLFYARKHNGLHIARECSPMILRPGLRFGWKRAVAASYLAELAMRTVARDEHHYEVYNLLTTSCDFLEKNTIRPAFLFWAELKFMDTLGLSPQLRKCVSCGEPCTPSKSYFFSAAEGGINCPKCMRIKNANAFTVPPDVLAMLQHWQCSASPNGSINTRCSLSQLTTCNQLLGMFLIYHLDLGIMPKSREIAFEMLYAPDNFTQKEKK
ncbi:MAG: DNA repair protein RecO [Lentisphaerae bacterium]|nr:DNA repair protein RecO [Lentisphaerota bacterium]